jgi:hypothetical protein
MHLLSFYLPFILPTGSTGSDGKGLEAGFAWKLRRAKEVLKFESSKVLKLGHFPCRPVDTRRVLSKYKEAS